MCKAILSITALVLSLILGGTATAQNSEPIRIGLMGPITGPWASEGQDMEKVVLILADEVNARGGINGRRISIEIGDDQGNPRNAVLAAQQLVAAGVVAVVGTYGSAVTEASQDIYAEAGVVQVATGSTSIRLSEKGFPLFFRTCPRDDEQGRILAEYVKSLGFKKVALLHDNTSYAKGLADEASALYRQAGIEEVFSDAITPGDRDFTAILTKIKETNPDVIVFTGYYPEAALMLRQKKEMNWAIAMIGGDATNNSALVEIAGPEASNGYYFVSPPGPGDITGEAAAKLLDSYQRRYNSIPSSVWAILAGDAFGVIVEAIQNAGPDSHKIAEYLHTSLKNYSGLTGDISFNEKGDRLGEVYRLYQVDSKGEFILQPQAPIVQP
ncbi:MAG: branched-chain amino acid ABC transporter substrate-binding protein [Deltaproteobacteria bacterium]|jgi:branched-chain amino acid transport system substrate-binding protein|nr:branched-chain amino acid ABC transporter substrate-binding protein [Deltaproteobacteria bacterium]